MRQRVPLAIGPDAPFVWATGIEDTFIGQPSARTGRILDEYALTDHYTRWREDLALIASLGVQAARYGIPWYRVCPRPGDYDWSWTDQVLHAMVSEHGVEPIIDLVHYGTPLWLEGSFLNPDYPARVADYAHAFAERYRGLCHWYTPLNEPRVNAWYAGRLGWWPPYKRSWRGFVHVLVALARGIALTQAAIAAADPEAGFVHVDATDLYVPADSEDVGLRQLAQHRQEVVFLAQDLIMGRVSDQHPLREWLATFGVDDADLEWFTAHAVRPDVLGVNMYPMFSRKLVSRTSRGQIRVSIQPCWTETLSKLLRAYAERYTSMPLMLTETASSGSVRRRVGWIRDSAAAVAEVRAYGLPIVGYTFWPLFSLVTWAYREGLCPPDDYLLDMGLWDLRRSPNGLERVRTPAVDAYMAIVAAGVPTSAR